MTRLGFALAGAVLFGLIGFLAGFLGPIFLTPGANQGPLLGIFITGPLCGVAGFLAGSIYGQKRDKAKRDNF